MTEYTIKLHSVLCYLPDESTDEVYLKFDGKKIWPKDEKFYSMNEGDSVELRIETSVVKGASIKIELWEFDDLSPDDKLGKFILEADKLGGPYTTDMVKEDEGKSKYALNWEVS